ncbi:MAG: UTP--glucose-1-phosphate uridylyltransferase [Alphaproteobacteria bacterium]|nr:UTP--glucose-1-phosphate uridylyltransferase [Alphaproteobacteria bacterium]
MSKPPKIRKAVFPVGGLGTRFLPATKSMPKEMLPVVDKPLIHYAFEEARAAGIEQFIFVTGRNKHAIEDHFDHVHELQSTLSKREKHRELELTSDWLPKPGNLVFVRQQEPLGLGHAVWCARHLVGDEPFAVILADDMVHAKKPCMQQMVEAYGKAGGNILGVMDIPREHTASYGILDIADKKQSKAALVKAKGLVEKPQPVEAPSTLSIIGRYILQPEIFNILEKQKPGAGGEIQLTDAIASLISAKNSRSRHANPARNFWDVHGYRFDGTRYDCGGLVGYVAANVAYALGRKDIRGDVLAELNAVFARMGVKK